MTTQTLEIRRRTNGATDIDRYRALMECKQGLSKSMSGIVLAGSPLVAVAFKTR